MGKLLSRYRAGKVPKAFKIVPSLSNWEEILFLTEPESWTPSAVFAATRLFASNLTATMAQRFYNLVLLPRVRADIGSNRRLHFALYQALKKAVYKPAAFYKGVLLPLCQVSITAGGGGSVGTMTWRVGPRQQRHFSRRSSFLGSRVGRQEPTGG